MTQKAVVGTTKIRCPYCSKVFLCRRKASDSDAERVSARCPNCGEGILIPTGTPRPA